MDELLKQLAESNLLTESTLATVRTQVETMITEAVQAKEKGRTNTWGPCWSAESNTLQIDSI